MSLILTLTLRVGVLMHLPSSYARFSRSIQENSSPTILRKACEPLSRAIESSARSYAISEIGTALHQVSVHIFGRGPSSRGTVPPPLMQFGTALLCGNK